MDIMRNDLVYKCDNIHDMDMEPPHTERRQTAFYDRIEAAWTTLQAAGGRRLPALSATKS